MARICGTCKHYIGGEPRACRLCQKRHCVDCAFHRPEPAVCILCEQQARLQKVNRPLWQDRDLPGWADDTPAMEDKQLMADFYKFSAATHRATECLPAGEPTPGGGSKSSRRKREKPAQRPVSELDNCLFNA